MALWPIQVILDYQGVDQGAVQYPTSAEDFVGITIAGNRESVRFGNLFTNTHPDVLDDEHLKRCLRRALVRNGSPQPNAPDFRTIINTQANSVNGEGGLWLPKKTYYVGTIENKGGEPSNRLWEMHYAESAAVANGAYPGGDLVLEFTDWDVQEDNRPLPSTIIKDLPGLLRRRPLGTVSVNPPAFNQTALDAFRADLNALWLEY